MILLVVAVLVVLSTASSARANDTRREAEQLLREGTRLRREAQREKAIAVFRRAYQLWPMAKPAALLAAALHATGQFVEAEDYYRRALAAGDDPYIQRHRAELEKALAFVERQLGTVIIEGVQAPAELRIDERLVGRLPGAAKHRVRAGTAVLEVRAAGYVPVRRVVEVRPGGVSRETIRLVALAGDGHQPSPPVGAAPAAATEDHPHPGHGLKIAAWITVGVAGAGLVAGAIGFGLGERHRSNYAGCVSSPGTSDREFCVGEYNAWQRNRTLGIAGIATGGALAAGSAVLFILARRSRVPANGGSRSTAWLSCGQGPGTLGLACGGQF